VIQPAITKAANHRPLLFLRALFHDRPDDLQVSIEQGVERIAYQTRPLSLASQANRSRRRPGQSPGLTIGLGYRSALVRLRCRATFETQFEPDC
jgi:hypothetical protein